ncbi:MAG: hypothetical protein ACI9HK_005875 [Pirellulaceae bacterium]|jgi:hypothetical protein
MNKSKCYVCWKFQKETTSRPANQRPAKMQIRSSRCAEFEIQATELSITGKSTRDFMWIIVIMKIVVYVWIRVFANVELGTQIAALAILYGLQVFLYSAVRVDGFMGDGRPVLVWRWTPTAERKWTSNQPFDSTDDVVTNADLSTTAPFEQPAFRGVDRTGTVQAINARSLSKRVLKRLFIFTCWAK